MKSLKTKIQEIKNINLESFDIDVLKAMQTEIKTKLKSLDDDIDEITQSIKGASVYKEFYGDTKLLPKKFTTPLRRIVSKQREVREIQKFQSRYEEELIMLDDIIMRIKLDETLNKIIGLTRFT